MIKPGDKVVCINNSPIMVNNKFNSSLSKLVVGKIYTVENIDNFDIWLVEVKSSHPTGGYQFANRFRKVEEDFGEQVLNNIKEQIKEEQLELV